MLENFLVKVCRLTQTYTPISRQLSAIHYIRDAVGETDSVLVLASGGVDSTVVCALLSKVLSRSSIWCRLPHARHRQLHLIAYMRCMSTLGLCGRAKASRLRAPYQFLAYDCIPSMLETSSCRRPLSLMGSGRLRYGILSIRKQSGPLSAIASWPSATKRFIGLV